MKPEQLELFTGTNQDGVIAMPMLHAKAPGAVPLTSAAIPFPAHRLVSLVRRVARAMDARDERLAAKYLRTERSRLVGRLQAQGFSRAVANGEGNRFAAAVERQRRAPDVNNHGDAA